MRAFLRFVLEQLEIKARAAHRDEEGGSMVFGTITLFTLALFTVLVFHVGMNAGDRMALQNAADAGAYSAALVEAEALESIAFLNDGMAFVYYTTLRYAVDACVYSTLRAFYAHDDWVRKKQSQRLQPVMEGPWQIFDAVTVRSNNPGARTGQIYDIPMDQRNQSIDYDWVILGKGQSSDLFEGSKRRYEQAAIHAGYLIPRGKKWLADIHWAERIILAGTPRMAVRRAVLVARLNGAERVAVSDDLDRVFRLEAGSGGSDEAGFSDGRTQSGSTRVDDALSTRYEELPNPLEKKKRKIPSWFNKAEGRPARDYSQVRLCWNKRDWEHSQEQGKYTTHNPGYLGLSQAPNGHWHVLHGHNIEVDILGTRVPLGPIYGAALDHDFGHGVQSGDDADKHTGDIVPGLPLQDPFYMMQTDLSAPNGSHHAAQTCPTCFRGRNDKSSRYTDVKHTLADGKEFLEQSLSNAENKGPYTEVRFDGQDDTFPRPIRLKSNVFRAGITVAAWRQGWGFGRFFPASPFGQLAIASAQIGVRNERGVVMVAQSVSNQSVTVSSFGDSPATRTISLGASGGTSAPENFYLGASQEERGLRFGARLVPIARDLSWAPSGGSGSGAARQGLGSLINGKRWFTQPNGEPEEAPAPIKRLKDVLDVGGAADDFAH